MFRNTRAPRCAQRIRISKAPRRLVVAPAQTCCGSSSALELVGNAGGLRDRRCCRSEPGDHDGGLDGGGDAIFWLKDHVLVLGFCELYERPLGAASAELAGALFRGLPGHVLLQSSASTAARSASMELFCMRGGLGSVSRRLAAPDDDLRPARGLHSLRRPADSRRARTATLWPTEDCAAATRRPAARRAHRGV